MNPPLQTSYRVFWGISSFQMLAMFRRGLFYSFLSVYLRHFLDMSITETTLFATFPMLANILFQTFVWGGISDRLQLRRTLIIIGELSAGGGTLAVWYLHRLPGEVRLSGWVIIIGLTVVEIFWSMSNVAWSALISDVYRAEDRGAVQGKLASIGGIGRIGGVWIGGLLYDGMGKMYAGWGFHQGTLFFIASGVMFLSALPMLLIPEGGVKRRFETEPPDPAESSGSEHFFYLFLIAMMLINFGRNSIAIIMTQYYVLESGLGVSSKQLSNIVNTQSAAIVLTGLAVGRITGKLGNGRTLLGATGVSVVALLILTATLDLKLIFLSNFMRGFSEVIIMSSAYAFASVLIPPLKRARLFALFNATFFLSWGIAGTLMAGPVADAFLAHGASEVFAYRMSFLSAAIMTFIGMCLLAALLWQHSRASESGAAPPDPAA